jgi:hypothetical protein
VSGCGRPVFAKGLCGFHALQGYYRAEAVPGVGLTAARVRRPPEMVVIFPDEAAAGQGGRR